MRCHPAVAVAVWLLSLGLAAAQTSTPSDAPATRAGALEAQRAARQQSLSPDPQHWLERTLFFVEEKRVLERLNPPEGFYPNLGGLTVGSGFGFGVGYRQRPARGRVLVDTSAAWTPKDYKTAQAQVAVQPRAGRPVELRAGTVWYDFTQEDFFGLGQATSRVDRVSYRLEGLDTFAQLQARKAGWLVVRGRLGLHRMTVGSGTDPRFPSVEETFTDVSAPGVEGASTLAYAQTSVGVDTRDEPNNTRGGGLYNLSFGAYRDRDGRFDFNRVDLRAMHVIPIFDKKRGIALHAMASRSDPVGSSRVPFYLMPTVGGANSIRGFREYRFRDAAAVNLNAEYRWEAFSGLDLALFFDAGDVGPTWRSLVGAKLRTSWGGGFRFNTNRRVFLRLDVADGREGRRLLINMGPVFAR
jgi:opacity protein-like surface antigen